MTNDAPLRIRHLEILDEALNAFRQETGLTAEKAWLDVRIPVRYADATIRLGDPARMVEYFAKIKQTLTNLTVGTLTPHLERPPGKWLVVTRYVPAYLAKKMKALNMQFIDTVGNAFINDPPLFIFMHGNRATRTTLPHLEEVAWGVAGVKVVFALLCMKELEDATYREIAETVQVALGTVAHALRGLARQGYLLNLGLRGRKLVKRRELLERWITAYAEKLRNRNLIGRFTTNRENPWEDVDVTNYRAFWGGEVAAHKLTHFMKPDTITIYARKPIENLLVDLRLRKDGAGKIELREQFWNFPALGPIKDVAPLVLVYADLLATADARNVETAKMIYDDYLKRHFE